jgi:ferredoxin-NADP reductase
MLHALAAVRSTRQVLWLYAAPDRKHHPFAAEVRRLMLALAHGRMTTQIVRRPWRQQITDSLDGGFAMQMFAHLAKNTAAHGRSHIGDAVAYVRKGKRNNFD